MTKRGAGKAHGAGQAGTPRVEGTPSPPPVMGTEAQQRRRFFQTFGYLSMPGLLRDEIGWITDEFEALMRDEAGIHQITKRTSMSACIERRERLCAILDLPQVHDLVETLLGPEWCYFSSDGNFYSGDTGWHVDSDWVHGTCIKIPLYLDSLDADSGALRLIPGSHRRYPGQGCLGADAGRSLEHWGVPGPEVPCLTVDNRPGDVLAFDTNCMHAAFGGGPRRRMIAIQFWTPFQTAEQLAELDKHMSNWAGGVRTLHSDLMYRTGGARRHRHLRQITQRHAVHPRYRDRPEVAVIVSQSHLAEGLSMLG